MLNHYQVWSDAFWNALGHGMSEAEAERHAGDKLAAFDKAQASRRRPVLAPEGQQNPTPNECAMTYHDYL